MLGFWLEFWLGLRGFAARLRLGLKLRGFAARLRLGRRSFFELVFQIRRVLRGGRFALGFGRRLRIVRDSHQVLLAAAFLQALEVPSDGGAHVVQMALFTHGNAFPAGRASPSGN